MEITTPLIVFCASFCSFRRRRKKVDWGKSVENNGPAAQPLGSQRTGEVTSQNAFTLGFFGKTVLSGCFVTNRISFKMMTTA